MLKDLLKKHSTKKREWSEQELIDLFRRVHDVERRDLVDEIRRADLARADDFLRPCGPKRYC